MTAEEQAIEDMGPELREAIRRFEKEALERLEAEAALATAEAADE